MQRTNPRVLDKKDKSVTLNEVQKTTRSIEDQARSAPQKPTDIGEIDVETSSNGRKGGIDFETFDNKKKFDEREEGGT